MANNSLDVAGVWRLQAQLTNASGKWPGETAQLTVYKPGN